MPETPRPWIGVDLDGTLAKFCNWRGTSHIGKPVPEMLKRVRQWLDDGYEVKIFTARASIETFLPAIRKWLKKHKLEHLEITNKLDPYCVEIWDDRGVQVCSNTGRAYLSMSVLSHPRAPLLEEAAPHENRVKLSEAAGPAPVTPAVTRR